MRSSIGHNSKPPSPIGRLARAFTLIELLVVVAIITMMLGVLLPALSNARQRSRATVCLSNLRNLGQGLVMYADAAGGRMLPGRLPKLDNDHWRAYIAGGWKYRPTFLAMMGMSVGIAPFEDPQASKTTTDKFGQAGDRQDYSSQVYVCPSVLSWTDERNGSYGYNYQFLGNSRLRDSSSSGSFKNWPVMMTNCARPATTVAVGDCMGTAAAFPESHRTEYANNAKDPEGLGNEGFNLDPPRLDPDGGEIADHSHGARSAADPRHAGRANILWLDSHGSADSMRELGYRVQTNGVVAQDGNNSRWSINGLDEAWTLE